MAWSDAARKAALEARKRKGGMTATERMNLVERHSPQRMVNRRFSEQQGQFHAGGTPKYDPHYLKPEVRQRAALHLRQVRSKLRAGGKYDWTFDEDKVRSAATVSSMRRHWQAPSRAETRARSVKSPYEPATLRKEARQRKKKADARRMSNYHQNYMPPIPKK